jgi:hypothetical protein
MSWFGGGLSNLQGKISSFTAQVLNEVAESVQGKRFIQKIFLHMTRHQAVRGLFLFRQLISKCHSVRLRNYICCKLRIHLSLILNAFVLFNCR